MIDGAHTVLFARDADAARRFLAGVLGLESVDAGGGWLIFALPPGEVAVHPSDGPPRHELYFMCDDLDATLRDLRERGARVGDVHEERWGLLSSIEVPGLGPLGIYEPRHPRARTG